MASLKQDYWQNYVDGNWVDGGAGRLMVENPGTGQPLAEIALADAADIEFDEDNVDDDIDADADDSAGLISDDLDEDDDILPGMPQEDE